MEQALSWVQVSGGGGSPTHAAEHLPQSEGHLSGNELTRPPEGAPRPTACPSCGSCHFEKHGTYLLKDGNRRQRYLCQDCGRTFNTNTGTPAAHLKKQNEWCQMAAKMDRSTSLRRMAVELGIHLTTAFRWRHRWLAAHCRQEQPALDGQVAVATVVVPYSEKGSRVCRGPGSWGYWDWLLRGRRPDDAPEPDPGQRPFRRLIDGRPTCVLLARNAAAHASLVLGPKPNADIIGKGIKELVSEDAEVHGFEVTLKGLPSVLAQACQRFNLCYRDGRQRTSGEGEGSPVGHPESPIGWLVQFRGVATRYLHHYMAWFSYQVTARTAMGA